jgi:hypothetical protein
VLADLAKNHGTDLIVMGEVGVYFHGRQSNEFSDDCSDRGEVFITAAAYLDIRDAHEVFWNRQLNRALITVEGVEVDLYLEHQNRLRFDFGELASRAEDMGGIQVASLEHLLFLKLTAAGHRRNASHGARDRREVAKMLVLLENTEPEIGVSAITDNDFQLLEFVLSSNSMLDIANGNAPRAQDLKQRAMRYVQALRR